MRLGYDVIEQIAEEYGDASMRPRRMRLGYRHQAPKRLYPHECFNEAEAHAPRIRYLEINEWPYTTPLQ